MPETENMSIMTRPEMIAQLRQGVAQGRSPEVAVAEWILTFPAEMARNWGINPGDRNWETLGYLPKPLSAEDVEVVIHEAFGGSQAKAHRIFRDAWVHLGNLAVARWVNQGLSPGEIAANCAKTGQSLDATIASLNWVYSDDDSALTRNALARDPKTPPSYLEALAGRALAGDLGLAIALRSNPAARALVDQSPPVEQLTLDGPDI